MSISCNTGYTPARTFLTERIFRSLRTFHTGCMTRTFVRGSHLALARAFLRGGNWDNTSNAGVFTLNLNNAPTNTNSNIGFRCARYVSASRRCLREQCRYGGTSVSWIHTDAIHLMCACKTYGKISDLYPYRVPVQYRTALGTVSRSPYQFFRTFTPRVYSADRYDPHRKNWYGGMLCYI